MDELRVGIVGFGFIGKVHAYGYLNMPLFYDPPPCRVRIVGIATSRPETAAKARALVPVEMVTTDYNELLARTDIDAIHVCTPNDTHADIVLKAMAAQKHIYCDKPLASSADEARCIVAAMKGYNGIHQMTLQYRFLPATLRARQLIEEGRIGRILSFRGAYLHAGYTDPNRPISWRLDAAKSGGGGLYDLGAHIVDLLQHLVGPFAAVCCTTETFVRQRPRADGSGMAPVEVDDLALLLVRTADGALGTVESSRIATGANDELRFEIHGDRGALRFNLMEPNWLDFYDNTVSDAPLGGTKGFTRIECVSRYPKPAGFPGPKFSIGWMRAHMHCLYNFVDAIVRGQPTHPDLRDGAQVQQVLDLAYTSSRSGKWMEIPAL